jgi:fibronectin type 3 domain-containing protein
MTKFRSALVLTISLTLLSSIFIPTGSAKATTLYPDDCAPAVLMLRGSGEGALETDEYNHREYVPTDNPEADPYIVTNGQEGPVIGRLVRKFVDKTYENGTENLTVSKVRFIGVDYDSLAVFPELNDYASAGAGSFGAIDNAARIISHIIKYDASYRSGAKAILKVIEEDERKGCNTQYSLMGYSQGMISVRIALNLLGNDTNKIVSTYAVGDPFQNPDGVTSNYQVSGASSSPNSKGVGLFSLDTIMGIDQLVHPADIAELSQYRNDVTNADPVIYRIGDSQNQYSRVLCHQYDLVCAPGWGSGLNEHTNYFNFAADQGTSGYIDILELEAFDKQVRTLAGSTFQNPGTRQLIGTVPIDGKATYNVKNARLETGNEDKCSWDVDSDGIYEADNIECGTYDAVHSVTSPTAKITLSIEDSFGNFHTLNLESESISSEAVDQITTLDPDKWYQFHPYGETESCIGFGAQDNYENVAAGMSLVEEDCEPSSAAIGGFEEKSALSKQTFKATPHHAANYPGEWDEFGKRLAWGYDEDYNLDSYDSYSTDGPVKLQLNDDYSSHHFEPRLAKVENGIPYYFIRHRDGNCVTLDENDMANINLACDSDPENQLFSVTSVEGEFGNLSLEKDVTAPSEIENLTVSDIELGSAILNWTEATDNRLGEVNYEIYNSEGVLEGTTSDTSFALDLSESPSVSNTFTVKAVDASSNKTSGAEITFDALSPLSKPDAPTLESLNAQVVINLPYSDTEPIDTVAVYRNGSFIGFSNGQSYTNSGLSYGAVYSYSYRTVTSYGLYSEMSEPLVVEARNNVAPSAPSDLTMILQSGNQVYMNWTPAVDDIDSPSYLTYHLYRDGVRLTANSWATATEGGDYDAQPGGTYVYTVRAEDSDGNLSEPSNAITVVIPIPDTTAPTAPTNFVVSSQDETSVNLLWDSSADDVDSSLIYELYRDGVLLTENVNIWENGAVDSDVTVGNTYVYVVRAVDSSGNQSEFSEGLVVTVQGPDITPPTKPQIQVADVQSDKAILSFYAEDDQGISYFEIYRDGVLLGTAYDSFYYDTPLTPDTTYEYTVIAKDNAGNASEVSDPLIVTTSGGIDPNTPVPAVESIYGRYVVHNTIEFGWSINNQTGLTYYYDVYRNGILVAENRSYNPYAEGINTDPFTYTDLGLEPDTTYIYEIVIKKQDGESSPMSTPLTLHTPPAPTSSSDEVRPSGVAMTIATNEYGLGIRWTPAVDDVAVASYKIYRDDVLLHTVTVNGTNHGNFYDDVTAVGSPEGTTYSYKIVVVDSSGNENAISLPMEVIVY